jgi:hypothetical protein
VKVGDLVKRKWVEAERGPIPKSYKAGLVVEFKDYHKNDPNWAVVRWFDGHGIGNSLYHPDNLEVISEGG